MDIKSTSQYSLPYLMIKELRIVCKLVEAMESTLIEILLFGNSLFGLKKNVLILSYASIDYILSAKRFEEALL